MRMMERETMIKNISPSTASRCRFPVICSAVAAGLSAARQEDYAYAAPPRCGKPAPPDSAHFSLPCSYNQTAVPGRRSDLCYRRRKHWLLLLSLQMLLPEIFCVCDTSRGGRRGAASAERRRLYGCICRNIQTDTPTSVMSARSYCSE